MATSTQHPASANLLQIGGFQLAEKIGAGGMGTVFRAQQESLTRTVALKILNPYFATDAKYIEAFRREAQAVARLQHPNIVAALDAGESDGQYYFVMEYVRGETIARWVKRRGAMPEQMVVDIAFCVASALKHAWDKEKLIHRDVKPENVMVDTDGNVKLCDLGLAKTSGEQSTISVTGQVFGTPQYMSPEQARGEKSLDFRTDIYSLGLLMHYALTAEIPFQAGSPALVMARHLTEQLPDPREKSPEVSVHTCRVLERMLARDVADRYPSWDDVLADLSLVRESKPPQCAPLPAGKSALKLNATISQPVAPIPLSAEATAAPRNQVRWAMVGIIAFVAILGIGIAFFVARNLPTDETNAPNIADKEEAARQRFADALAFAQANPTAHAEIKSRLEKLAKEFHDTPEAQQAQQLLSVLAAHTAPPPAAAQPPKVGAPPNAPPPPPQNFNDLLRASQERAAQNRQAWNDLLARAAKLAQEQERARQQQEAARLAEQTRKDAETRRLAEEKARAEAARAQQEAAHLESLRAFDNFARPYLAALRQRDYSEALRLTAQAATENPKPPADALAVTENVARRLQKLWDSLADSSKRLGGTIITLQNATGKVVDSNNAEIVLELGPEASVGIPISTLSPAEALFLAGISPSSINQQSLLDAAWLNFADGKIAEANAYLEAAQRNGADTAATRHVMTLFVKGAVENEAEQNFRQLQSLVDGKKWAEAKTQLDFVKSRFLETKTIQASAVTLSDLEKKITAALKPPPPPPRRPW